MQKSYLNNRCQTVKVDFFSDFLKEFPVHCVLLLMTQLNPLLRWFAHGALFGAFVTVCGAQQAATIPQPTPYSVISRSSSQRIWQRTVYELSPNGQAVPHTEQYTEISDGACFLKNGQWYDSQPEIVIMPDGSACGTNSPCQVLFPPDLGDAPIQLISQEGLQIQITPSALCYDDGSNTIILATLTNTVAGGLLGTQEVIYSHAFSGLDADVLYTYGQGGRFEQDIILHQRPPDPGSLGLNPQTTCLKMLTAFVTASQPAVNPVPVQTAAGEATDDNLEFGSIKMIPGKALLLGTNQASLRVSKQWIQLDGRNFLVESVPVTAVADGLSALPASAARQSTHGKLRNLLMALHPQRRAMEKSGRKISISRIASPACGLLMDFVTINGGLTNYVFRSDSTYYISGSGVTLFGTNNVFEGGAVIKFAFSGPWTFYATGPSIEIASSSQTEWPIDQYRPVIFTSKDDDTIGTAITGSTGSPNGYYGDPMLDIVSGGEQTISNFRMAYAEQAAIINNSTANFWDGQFVDCLNGITGGFTETYFGNALFANVSTNFDNFAEATIVAQNVTFSGSDCFWGQSSGTSFTFGLTNCIFANVTNFDTYAASATNIIGAYNGNFNSFLSAYYATVGATLATNVNPFETIGGGAYYLTQNCVFHSAGTPNIDPSLLADLATKSTYAPVVYDETNISLLGTLGPQTPRDTNTAAGSVPDLGWHYPPLDYVFGGCDLTNNLTFTAGTAVGWFEDSGSLYEHYPYPPYGIGLGDSASLSFDGNATEPDAFVKFNTVQEGVNGAWDQSGFLGAMMFDGDDTNHDPQFSANFTEFSQDAAGGNLFRDDWEYGAAGFNNCEFYTASFSTYDMQYLDFTNCLLFRCDASFYSSGYQGSPLGEGYALSYAFENCTFYNGSLFSGRYSGSNPFNDAGLSSSFWLIENCAIDGTAFSWSDCLNGNPTNTLFNYNAYNTNNPIDNRII
jgi:hypothetical protein